MKFNKNKCFFASVYVAAVSAMTFTGFTSYAAEQNAQINETLSLIRGEEIQWAVSEIVQNAQKTTVEETLTAVNEAKAAYEAAFGMPVSKLVGLGTAVNPHITSLSTFVIFAVAPFNLIKGVAVSAIVFVIYKKISPVLRMR